MRNSTIMSMFYKKENQQILKNETSSSQSGIEHKDNLLNKKREIEKEKKEEVDLPLSKAAYNCGNNAHLKSFKENFDYKNCNSTLGDDLTLLKANEISSDTVGSIPLIKPDSTFIVLPEDDPLTSVKLPEKSKDRVAISCSNVANFKESAQTEQTPEVSSNIAVNTDESIKYLKQKFNDGVAEIIKQEPANASLNDEKGKSINNNDPEKTDGPTCIICFETDNEFLSSKCGHILCEPCWTKLLSIKFECPICKAKVRQKQLSKITY